MRMRYLPLLLLACIFFASCSNSGKSAKTFCDTNCKTNELNFKGEAPFNQSATLKLSNCLADSLIWTHELTINRRKINVGEALDANITINPAAVKCYFQDTTLIWLSFNDCVTGRGYLLKLPYNADGTIRKVKGALNSFDSKFAVDPDLRAYTDRGNLYVDNVTDGKSAEMTFKKEYDMDFADIHKYIDTLNVTKKRMYIVLIDKDGNKVPFEKKIEL